MFANMFHQGWSPQADDRQSQLLSLSLLVIQRRGSEEKQATKNAI